MMKERNKNACVAVKRGVRVRRNCNVFNLAMENVLKGLPDKIRDQLSRHHTHNSEYDHYDEHEIICFHLIFTRSQQIKKCPNCTTRFHIHYIIGLIIMIIYIISVKY